jgi:hypothetical protein
MIPLIGKANDKELSFEVGLGKFANMDDDAFALEEASGC